MRKFTTVLILIYISSLSLWIYSLFMDTPTKLLIGYYLQIPLALIPLLSGLRGIAIYKLWGGTNTKMGNSILFLSLGMISWSIGMFVWNYYIFFGGKTIPYPSYADPFFSLSVPFWSIGVWNMGKVIGAGYALKSKRGRLEFACICFFMAILSYILLFLVARGGVIDTTLGFITLFFDLYYPFSTACITTFVLLAYVLSQKYLGGVYKRATIMLFLGFFIFFTGDFLFSYSTTTDTYYNGHLADMLFTTGMMVLGSALNSYSPGKN